MRWSAAVAVAPVLVMGISGVVRADEVLPFQPALPARFVGIPLDGGRTQAIAVDPTDEHKAIVATQWGGFWKTIDRGAHWAHLDRLHAVFAVDVAIGPDGRNVIATKARDNGVVNGGGIWVSHDGGVTWSSPPSAQPPASARSPARVSGYGISWAPGHPLRAFVGTDYGVAITDDAGETWRHVAVETTSAVSSDRMQSSVHSILALPGNVALAATRTGIYRYNGGGPWMRVRTGDFTASFKLMDVSPVDPDKVFVMQDYSRLYLYEVAANTWTELALPGGSSRWPFVRVARTADGGSAIDIWVGLGVSLGRATCADISCVRRLTATSWTLLGRPEGIHDDSGFMGLNASARPVFYGSDGGLFRPTDATGATWARASVSDSGFNSYEITSLAGTTFLRPTRTTSLYFATQDNGLWASGDGGLTWPGVDCAEGFHVQAPAGATFSSGVTIAYGKVGCGPSGNMFNDPAFASPRAIPDVDTAGLALTDMGQAFFIKPHNWIRGRFPVGANPELWVSTDDGAHWRRRATVTLQLAGPPHLSVDTTTGRAVAVVPCFGSSTWPSGDRRIGLIRLADPTATGEVTLGEAALLYLPAGGSLGQRATEFDWQAVFDVQPTDSTYIIAPDVANNCVRITHDGGVTFPCDAALTDLVLQSGALKMYDGDPWHLAVTHIKFDPRDASQVLVGTRDAGVVWGYAPGLWRVIDGSEVISYLTGFFRRDDGVIVASSYGQGLWELNVSVHSIPFPPHFYCAVPCVVPVPDPADWMRYTDVDEFIRDKEVIIALRGEIVGLQTTPKKAIAVTVTPGTRVEYFVPKGAKRENVIVREGKPGIVTPKMKEKGPLTGIVVARGQVASFVRSELLEPVGGPPQSGPQPPPPQRPHILLSSDASLAGSIVLRKNDTLHILARNFAPGEVRVELDGQTVQKLTLQKVNIDQTGGFQITLARPSTLRAGQHQVRVVEAVDGKEVAAAATFAATDVDDDFRRKQP